MLTIVHIIVHNIMLTIVHNIMLTNSQLSADVTVSGACEGGHYYTADGCVQCAAGYWLPAGDSDTNTIGSKINL